MTDTPKVIEVDCATGITTERDMTTEEIALMQAQAEAYAKQQAEAEAEKAAKEAARLAVLAKLGLTPEEAAVLIG